MELSIKEDRMNPLLDRREVLFEIKSVVTPSRTDVKKELVKKTMADDNLIVIQRLDQRYGEHLVDGYAKIYKSADKLKRIEQSYLLERGKPGKKKEVGEKKTEAKAEKPKPEEKKEEVKNG